MFELDRSLRCKLLPVRFAKSTTHRLAASKGGMGGRLPPIILQPVEGIGAAAIHIGVEAAA